MPSTAAEVDIPPEVLGKWQDIVDMLAEVIHVPSALVVKVEPPVAKVLLSSDSTGNPCQGGFVSDLGTGLYCETVMKTRLPLLVADALQEEEWKHNPDIQLGLISYLGYPVTWPDGQIFGTICVLDIKRNEYSPLYRRFLLQCRDLLQADLKSLANLGRELATQRAHLEELFARVPEAIVLLDVDDRIIRINPEFTTIFGYTEEEAVGRLLKDLIAPGDLRDQAQEFRGRETLTLEAVRRHKTGTRVPVSIVGVPLLSAGGQSFTYAIYRDITERRRLQDELKCERDRLRLLLEITNSMVSKLDLRHLIEALSTNFLSVLRCDQCCLLLPDPDSGQLRATVLYNAKGRVVASEGTIVPIHGSIEGKVFQTAKSLWVKSFEEVRENQELAGNADGQRIFASLTTEGLKSGCYLPLVTRDRVVGVLTAGKRSKNTFADEDVSFFEQVAHQVAMAVENALDYGQAREDRDKETEQKLYLLEEIRADRNFGEIVGESRALKSVLQQVSIVAPTDSGVLILGETGTGKELIARAIHDLSARRDRPFVKLNCAAIPLGLLESELFGHEKGAFTGAIAQKIGRFELANKGTLFLDEVGDIPLALQAKLLRVLQEQEFERLGSNRTHKVSVRIIAATHNDLAKMVKQQAFREDLYYRLKVFPITVPALRERAEDIPALVRHFARHYAQKMNKKIETIPAPVMEALVRYRWPGNVRELQNFVERAVILSPDSVLCAPVAELEPYHPVPRPNRPVNALAQAEREQIVRALEESKWVVGGRNGAATRLGLTRTSLVYRMQKLGISRAAAQGA
jgi:formate hydrogenlyase transcriptional activator